MDESVHPIAIAHMQGLQAGKSAGMTPLECPWPIQNYDACLARFAGYSIGDLARRNERRSGDTDAATLSTHRPTGGP